MLSVHAAKPRAAGDPTGCGSPEHSRITIHFLNAILGDLLRISDITIENPFLGKEGEDDKLSVLDIRATDQHGRQLNIEMQTTLPAGMAQRLTYYTARVYSGQLNDGDLYTVLRPAISICVLSKAMFPGIPDLHLDFELRTSKGLLLTDDLQVHLLELSKLALTAENVSKAGAIEQWAYFMLNADQLTMDDVQRLFPDHEFAEAAGVLEMISKTPEQQHLYEARLKFQLDEAARLELARELAREEGLREGEAKGRIEGEAKGRIEGEAKGRIEGETRGAARGVLLGRIAILQELLGISDPAADELSSYDERKLSELADKLQNQLRNRRQ